MEEKEQEEVTGYKEAGKKTLGCTTFSVGGDLPASRRGHRQPMWFGPVEMNDPTNRISLWAAL